MEEREHVAVLYQELKTDYPLEITTKTTKLYINRHQVKTLHYPKSK